MNDSQIATLEEVIIADGNCMGTRKCSTCPLNVSCFKEMIKTRSVQERRHNRVNKAKDTLIAIALLGFE